MAAGCQGLNSSPKNSCARPNPSTSLVTVFAGSLYRNNQGKTRSSGWAPLPQVGTGVLLRKDQDTTLRGKTV